MGNPNNWLDTGYAYIAIAGVILSAQRTVLNLPAGSTATDNPTTGQTDITIAGTGSGISAITGDVTASGSGSVAAVVRALQGVPVTTNAPVTGNVLTYNGTSWTPATPSVSSAVASTGLWYTSGSTLHPQGVALTGDLSQGALSSNSLPVAVTGINGATVPAAGGALVTGNSLYASAGGALSYSALNLAGGAGWVTGALPAANQAAQTMGGDVTGTTGASTVVQARGGAFTFAAGANYGGTGVSSALGRVWLGTGLTFGSTNYAIQSDGTTLTVNAGTTVNINAAASTQLSIGTLNVTVVAGNNLLVNSAISGSIGNGAGYLGLAQVTTAPTSSLSVNSIIYNDGVAINLYPSGVTGSTATFSKTAAQFYVGSGAPVLFAGIQGIAGSLSVPALYMGAGFVPSSANFILSYATGIGTFNGGTQAQISVGASPYFVCFSSAAATQSGISLGVGGTITNGGSGTLQLVNGTAPTVAISGGAVMYASGGAIFGYPAGVTLPTFRVDSLGVYAENGADLVVNASHFSALGSGLIALGKATTNPTGSQTNGCCIYADATTGAFGLIVPSSGSPAITCSSSALAINVPLAGTAANPFAFQGTSVSIGLGGTTTLTAAQAASPFIQLTATGTTTSQVILDFSTHASTGMFFVSLAGIAWGASIGITFKNGTASAAYSTSAVLPRGLGFWVSTSGANSISATF